MSVERQSATRRILLVAVWLIILVGVLWLFASRPATDDDEYWKWFLFGTVLSSIRLVIDLIILLVIAFSLERRVTRARVWILSLWTLGLAGPAWLVALREGLKVDPIWGRSVRDTIWVFAYPYLFALLLMLLVALWIEALAGSRLE
jgi:hypothetical protein